jgi:hypothetical protein
VERVSHSAEVAGSVRCARGAPGGNDPIYSARSAASVPDTAALLFGVTASDPLTFVGGR